MIIEKEVECSSVVKIEVTQKDFIEQINNEEEALSTIMLIDESMSSWPFTVMAVTKLLELINENANEVYPESISSGFMNALDESRKLFFNRFNNDVE